MSTWAFLMTKDTLKYVLKQFDYHKGRNLGDAYFLVGPKAQKLHFSINKNNVLMLSGYRGLNYVKNTKTCDKEILPYTG